MRRRRGVGLPYRAELDAIRGVAVLIVLFQHFGLAGVGEDNHRAGQVGVTLFFVLSGYLITSLLRSEYAATGKVSLRAFYVRRFRRLFPALAFMLGVVGVVSWAQDRDMTAQVLIAGTYLTNIGHHFIEMRELDHTWTLAIEEQFYLLWPALFLALARWPKVMVGTLVAIVVVSAFVVPETRPLHRSDALLAGALIAGRRFPAWVGLGGWGIVLACALVPGDMDDPILNLATVGAVAVVGGSRFQAPSLVRIGAVSYGIYLWQYPMAWIVQPAQASVSPVMAVTLTMLGIAGTFILAEVSARYVERRWRLRRHEPDLVAPVGVVEPLVPKAQTAPARLLGQE